jgi:hypothetical protein
MFDNTDLLFQQYFSAEMFDKSLPGAPPDGEFRAQVLRSNSLLDAFLHEMLFLGDKRIAGGKTQEMIAVILMMNKSRKATKAEILQSATKLPYIQRALLQSKTTEKAHAAQLLSDIKGYLDEERFRYEVKFPPGDYTKLRPEPGLQARKDDKEMWAAWALEVGTEMAEEENDPKGEMRYNWDYGMPLSQWGDAFDDEMNQRAGSGTGPVESVHILPSGMENVIFASFYPKQPQDNDATLVTTPSSNPCKSFSALPAEIKTRIARFVLVFPGKLGTSAEITRRTNRADDWVQGRTNFDLMERYTFKFSAHVKVPKFMVPMDAATKFIRSVDDGTPQAARDLCYYWSLEPPAMMLSLLEVNKEMHDIGKCVFYGENYFEIKDAYKNPHGFSTGDPMCNDPQAHRFLELMSWSKARDGTSRYGRRPLELMRKINVDMQFGYFEDGEPPGQDPRDFERIVDTLIAASCLKKLVINVRMSCLDMWLKDEPVNQYLHPELWPGWRKLPWAASAISLETTKLSSSVPGLKVFVPENRKAEKWLQDLIDMPDRMRAKIGDVTPQDWSTGEFSSKLITDGLLQAEQRWMKACKEADTVDG